MSDIMEYKCPACGGAMEFDSKSQKMKCPYCDTEMSIEEFQQTQQGKQDGAENAPGGSASDDVNWQAASDGQWSEGETNGMRVYACESCGGEIVADENTGATSCPFCGNRVVMKGQFSGDLKPDYIIPFKLDKKAAKEAYHKHLHGKKFLPKVFKQENHIDEIKGVYVPFWIFDADANANIRYKATRVRAWSDSNYNYTETSFFSVTRGGHIGFEKVPVDGSTKMADDLMESIEPFDFSEAVDFQTAYLAGYMADKYDVDAEQSIGRASDSDVCGKRFVTVGG